MHDPLSAIEAASVARRERQQIEQAVEAVKLDPRPVPPRDGTSRLDAHGFTEVWFNRGWYSPSCLPSAGALAYHRRERELDRAAYSTPGSDR